MDIILVFSRLFKTLEFPVHNSEGGKVYTYMGNSFELIIECSVDEEIDEEIKKG